jgi:hypothetical protein
MAEKIDIHKFFPSIPNVAEEFKKQHWNEEHTQEEWWFLFKKYLDEKDD